jgi:hypothetical protein
LAKLQKQHNVTATFILGDLTQEKDNHSAALVNRTIDEMTRLRPPVFILMGNHDGISPDNPFFKFTDYIDGFEYRSDPSFDSVRGVCFIPHCRTQQDFDRAVGVLKLHQATVMCHQTFDGAIAETGAKLSGLSTKALELSKPKLVLAGDVHKPQHQGIVHYVGAPYHVRFGDNFEPRVLLIDGTSTKDLHFDAPRKWVVRTNKAYRLPDHVRRGDQVKVYLELGREEAVHWHHHRRAMLGLCRDMGLEVFGIDMKIQQVNGKAEGVEGHQLKTPKEVMTAFCQHEGLKDGLRTTGFRLLAAEPGTAGQAPQALVTG